MKKIKQNKKIGEIYNYDSKTDVFYIGIKNGREDECVEIAPGVNVEIGEEGKVIGVEILNASKIFNLITNPLKRGKNIFQRSVFSTVN